MEYTPMAIWGRELKHYRQAAGLTQVELAQKINYSPSLISQVETGQVPGTEEFAAACEREPNTGGTLGRTLDYRKGSVFPTWFGKWLPYERTPWDTRAVCARYAGKRQYRRVPGNCREWLGDRRPGRHRTSRGPVGVDQGRGTAAGNVQGIDQADDGGTMGVVTTPWRKSSRSGANNDDCVEVAVAEQERD